LIEYTNKAVIAYQSSDKRSRHLVYASNSAAGGAEIQLLEAGKSGTPKFIYMEKGNAIYTEDLNNAVLKGA
jgi:hypothetical protein